MGIRAKDFKPKVRGRSDFYSWQLYRFLSKYPDRYKVFSATWNPWTGVDKNKKTLFIGVMENCGTWFHGKELRRLCLAGQSLECYAYHHSGHDVKNWTDITKEFWEKYRKIGVCAIHDDLAHEWKYISESHRQCVYCNAEEFKSLKMVEKEIWEQAA